MTPRESSLSRVEGDVMLARGGTVPRESHGRERMESLGREGRERRESSRPRTREQSLARLEDREGREGSRSRPRTRDHSPGNMLKSR